MAHKPLVLGSSKSAKTIDFVFAPVFAKRTENDPPNGAVFANGDDGPFGFGVVFASRFRRVA
jgi:hypothetical protein